MANLGLSSTTTGAPAVQSSDLDGVEQLFNMTPVSDALGSMLNMTPITAPIEAVWDNMTVVDVEKVPMAGGGEMEVGRGMLQRFTDPLDLEHPWASILYLIGDIYVFFCLHLVVHSRFSVAMEKIVELSQMNEDVAGATLMAIGTSLPEVLSGVIGVFVPGAGDTGLGTVVGSLVFNMLVITGCCVALFPKAHLVLSRSATIRDVTFQVIVIGMLVWAFSDKQADISNVIMFLLLYVVYILVCAQSGTIANACACDATHNQLEDDEDESKESKDSEEESKDTEDLMLKEHEGGHEQHPGLERFWPPPSNPKDLVIWILSIPLMIIEALVVLTIPDVLSESWKPMMKTALGLNLLASTIWLGTLVLFMIEWATKAGELVGITPAVMGLTFCAAGTSVPDCMVSIIVAKQGKGNMAISNVFGSNVFDILIAMAVPWALKYAISGTDNKVKMEAEGFDSAICILILVLLFYVTCVCVCRFRLPRKVGYLHIAMYVVFIIYVFTKNMSVFREKLPDGHLEGHENR